MPISGSRDITGLTKQQAIDGVNVGNLPGDGGLGPSTLVVIASASGLPPNNPGITIQFIPSFNIQAGTDSLGQIGVVTTFVNNGNDKTFAWSGGSASFPNGVWQNLVRAIVTSPGGCSVDLNLSYSYPDPNDPNDFTHDNSNPPTNLVASDESYDPDTDEGDVKISFTFTNPDGFNPVALVVMRDGLAQGSIPWTNGVTSYSFNDKVFNAGGHTYTYTVRAYKYGSPNLITSNSSSIQVSFGGSLPDISITGSGGLTIGGSATMVLIADPSGLYVLTPNKTHDTLYQRNGSSSTYNVKIPNPFAITSYLGS